MKKLAFLALLAFVSLGAMTACDDDDKKTVNVPVAVKSAFGEMFPDASRVVWSDRGGYVVANFNNGTMPMQAWFDPAGKWYMTEEDVPYASLPQAVRTAFEAGEYADWHIDDIDKLVREGLETVYVIEVEQRDAEYDLVYSEDGVLLRAVPDTDGDDDHDDMLPQELSKAITDFIAQKYPGARILDAEREKGNIEVDIVYDRKALEVCFGTGDVWLWTKAEVRLSEVPNVVMQALRASQYGAWEIDDVDHYDSPDRQWYAFELEDPRSERETTVRILADGTLI